MKKMLRLTLVTAVILVAVTAAFFYQPPPPKRVFINGQVLTMNPSNDIAEAIAVDNGKVIAVGSTAEITAHIDSATQVTDLQGKTLIPGFIDAHGHFPVSGMKNLGVDLNSPPIGSIKSMKALLLAVEKKVATLDEGQWLLGIGYDDTLLSEQRHPTREELDNISDKHPIFLWHISGHMGVANSLALSLVDYDKNTPDPDGGIIARDPATGELNGLLQETAAMPVQMLAMDFGVIDFLKMARYAGEQYARAGVTTSQTASASVSMINGLALAKKLNLVPFRQVLLPKYDVAGPELLDGSFDPNEMNDDYFHVGAVKITSDGSIQGYTGYLSQPYHTPHNHDNDYRGYPVLSRDELTDEVIKFHKAGYQLHIHANGDAAIDNVIHAFYEAQKVAPRNDARPVIIHAQMARDDQLDKMKALGITPSFFSAHTYYWGDRHRDIFMGPERAARMSPAKSAQDRDLRYTIHLDPPVVPMDPLMLVWTAVNRLSSSGNVIGAEQRIDPMSALKAVTIDAAWQVYQEGNRGSLEPGKWADLVVLSGDPLKDNGIAIKDLRVLETVVGGRTIYNAQ